MRFETLTPQQMADCGTSAPAESRGNDPRPHSLRDALRAATARHSSSTTSLSSSASEEDYDAKTHQPVAVLLQRKDPDSSPKTVAMDSGESTPTDTSFEASVAKSAPRKASKVYTIISDDKELREILRRGLQRVSE